MNRTYSELIKLESFEERYNYLKLSGKVGKETFGSKRLLNQTLYSSKEWKHFRNKVIVRDNGCDLGCSDRSVKGSIYIHHINPITAEDIINGSDMIFNMENVICCSFITHQAIHYGDESLLIHDISVRSSNDTCPWKGGN